MEMKQRKQKFDHSYRQASGGKHGFPRCLGIRYLQSFVFKSVPEQQALTLIRLTQDAVCSRQCFKYKGEKEQKQKVEETTLHILWSRSPSKSWQFLSVRCPPQKKNVTQKNVVGGLTLAFVGKSIHNKRWQDLLVYSAASRHCQLWRGISHSDRAHICTLQTFMSISILHTTEDLYLQMLWQA